MTSTQNPVGACGDTAPTGDPVTAARATLAADQYLYTSHAHLELIVLAYRSGHHWQIDQAINAAGRHLDNYLKDRP